MALGYSITTPDIVRRSADDSTGEVIIQDSAITTASQTITDGDTTPSVANIRYLKTSNTSATTITDFDDAGGDYHHIIVFFNDNDTIVAHDAAKISLPSAVSIAPNTGDIMEFLYINTVWYGWNSRLA